MLWGGLGAGFQTGAGWGGVREFPDRPGQAASGRWCAGAMFPERQTPAARMLPGSRLLEREFHGEMRWQVSWKSALG